MVSQVVVSGVAGRDERPVKFFLYLANDGNFNPKTLRFIFNASECGAIGSAHVRTICNPHYMSYLQRYILIILILYNSISIISS